MTERKSSSRHEISEELQEAFERSIDEGEERLTRTWPGLLATGLVGGIDVGFGVFAMLLVQHSTGNHLLGSLAFTIGFIALTLARSELFTENFLVPIAAYAADRAPLTSVFRLWGGTFVTNMLGGWAIMGIVMVALPDLREVAVKAGEHFPNLGIGAESFASGVLAGALLTLMTWMERGTTSDGARLLAAIAASFLLAAGQLNHAVVGALEMFAALQVGAPFGYADLAGTQAWAILANMTGGIGLVTMLRLVQIGRLKLKEEQSRS